MLRPPAHRLLPLAPAPLTGLPGARRSCSDRPSRVRRRGGVVLAAAVTLALAGCTAPNPPQAGGTPASAVPSSAPTPGPSATASAGAAGTTSCEYTESGEAAKPATLPPAADVAARGTVAYTLAMTGGPVTITMDRSAAPCTVNSFVSLADQGYFDGTRCHRLADSGIFVLQCGDPSATGSGGPGYAFADETRGGESYLRGVVAMANAGPNTNGSQFFLVWEDSTALDRQPNYTIFGRMDPASRDVVAQMAGEGQDGSNPDETGKPNNPAEIIRVTKS